MPSAQPNRDSDLELLLESYEGNPALSAQSIRSMARADPEGFLAAGLRLLLRLHFSPALRCMGMTLVQDQRLPRRVLDLIGQPRESFLGLVRALMQCDPAFDLKVLDVLKDPRGKALFDFAQTARAIDILDRVSDGLRLLPFMRQLLEDPDPRIQSKAAIFIGRRTQNPDWAQQQLRGENPRVRANVIEVLDESVSPAAKQMVRNAVADSNNRVMGNALLGLYRMGDTASLPLIFQMAKRPEFEFRSTAAWVMGSTGDARFAMALAGLLKDSESRVRENAFRGLKLVRIGRDAALSKPLLRMSVLRFSQEQNTANLTVVVQDGSGNACEHISPTSWILTNGNGIVPEYSVDAVDNKTPLSVAFLSADSTESGGREFGREIEAVESCLRLRRPDDRWAFLKLKPVAGSFELQKGTVLHLKESARSLVATPFPCAVRFSVSFRDIEGMLSAQAVKVPGTAEEVIGAACHEVLAAPEFPGDKKHLICLGASGLEGLIGSLGPDPANCRLTLHVIALPEEPRATELDALARSTGGSFVIAPAAEAIPQVCEAIYTGLRHRYQLRWDGRPDHFDVDLRAESGHAEVRWLKSG